MIEVNKIYNEQNLETMARMPDGYCDCIVTDPPYGYSFMQKDWDKAVPSVEIWKECLRVLKPGAFAFIMCAPRQDVLSHMIVNLTQAGFRTDFTSLYHCYASGFPKAINISKQVDKQAGAEREVIGKADSRSKYDNYTRGDKIISNNSDASNFGINNGKALIDITADTTDQAKALSGSFGGFQPKPALEVIIVVMKPIDCKTFTEQAMKNGHGCTWLDDCRIPLNEKLPNYTVGKNQGEGFSINPYFTRENQKERAENGENPRYDLTGRFPANLLVSDDALNDGNVYEGGYRINPSSQSGSEFHNNSGVGERGYNDAGSFSRYFSLDAWFAERLKNFPKSVLQTFPFLIEPKASKSEKNFGCNSMPQTYSPTMGGGIGVKDARDVRKLNGHPTVKPVKLMSYLITLGSRENEIVYDPFCGSGSTGVAAEMLNRKWILSEMDKDSCAIAEKRLYPFKIVQKLF